METEIIRFNLLSPLCYVPEENPNPFGCREGSGEKLFCFELDEDQYSSFEPDMQKLLKSLVFGGDAVTGEGKGDGKTVFQLPGGNYLFAQKREILKKEEIIALAVEIQLEGLWQRLLPGKMLYLRYLFEDGRPVTQLFRPYHRKGESGA